MPADLLPVERATPAPIRQAGPGDWSDPRLLRDYFSSAAPGIGRELEISSLQSLFHRALDPPVLVGLLAEASTDAVGGLLVEAREWDTGLLSAQIRNLTLVSTANSPQSRYAIARVLAAHCLLHARDALGDCTYARIPSDDPPLLKALQEMGFSVLVPMVTLGKKLRGDVNNENREISPAKIEFGEIRGEEVDHLEAISATAFRWGRFSADFRLPRDRVQKLHGTWARNCCLGTQADHVIVARSHGKLLGFIALKFQAAHNTPVGSIELIAIANDARGKGIGGALVQRGCSWLSRFTKDVVVRTELPNTSAVRMYEAQGFRLLNGSLYLSRWQR